MAGWTQGFSCSDRRGLGVLAPDGTVKPDSRVLFFLMRLTEKEHVGEEVAQRQLPDTAVEMRSDLTLWETT